MEPPTSHHESGRALCAVHEGMEAGGTCERCGNFVCARCLDPFGRLPDHCAACRERGGGNLIAWEREDGSWLSRWWQTTRDVVLRPRVTFASTRPGSVGAAVGYAALTGTFLGLVFSGLLACLFCVLLGASDSVVGDVLSARAGLDSDLAVGIMAGLMVLYPVLFGIAMMVSVMIRTLLYHGAVALMGGTGGINTSSWAVSYLHAIQIAILPLAFLQQIPIIGLPIGLIGYGAIEVFIATQLSESARDYHGLEGGRATFAGWSTFIVLAVLGATCCIGAAALVAFGQR